MVKNYFPNESAKEAGRHTRIDSGIRRKRKGKSMTKEGFRSGEIRKDLIIQKE
jgi:hypothetical protein